MLYHFISSKKKTTHLNVLTQSIRLISLSWSLIICIYCFVFTILRSCVYIFMIMPLCLIFPLFLITILELNLNFEQFKSIFPFSIFLLHWCLDLSYASNFGMLSFKLVGTISIFILFSFWFYMNELCCMLCFLWFCFRLQYCHRF